MLTPIKDRIVVVTGASKGIGKGIARVFAGHGARVLVVSRHIEEAEAAARELGSNTQACAADISDWAGPANETSRVSAHRQNVDDALLKLHGDHR